MGGERVGRSLLFVSYKRAGPNSQSCVFLNSDVINVLVFMQFYGWDQVNYNYSPIFCYIMFN